MRQALLTLALLQAILNPLPGQTVDEQKVLGQYRQFRWTDLDGLPQNSVFSIAQTPDGYLWFATAEGLARFDGLNFTTFSAKQLHQDWLDNMSLLTDHNGALWIASRTGQVTRYKDGVFTAFSATAGFGVTSQMIEDRAGDIWMPTFASGLVRIHQGETRAFTVQDGLPINRITSVAEDGTGRLWVGTPRGLAFFEKGRIRLFGKGDGFPGGSIQALCADRSGSLWLAVDGRIMTFSGGGFHLHPSAPKGDVIALFCDRENRIWVGTSKRGIVLLENGKALTYQPAPEEPVLAIFQDADGAIWAGTNSSGLYQWRTLPFEAFGVESGLKRDMRAVLQDSSGAMWFGAEYVVYRVQNGVVTEWPKRLRGGSIAEDSSGGLWLTDMVSAFRYRQGRLTGIVHPGFPHRLESMYGDRRGDLWLGSDDSGFCRWHDKQLTCFKGKDANANYVFGFHEDRSGAVWIATANGVKRWREGVLETWTTKDGLASNQTASFYETSAGSLWIGSQNGGLSRYKDGRFSRVTVDNGLFDNVAFAILEDDDGNLWMSCNRGIYRVRLRELEECANGQRKTVQSYSYGVADGMLSRECNGAFPAGWRSTDGRLWFTTLNGVVAIDPKRIQAGRAPSVEIEEVNAGGPFAAGSEVRLGRGQENLEIRYTALRCARPKQAHFKVKLEGLDSDWTDMGLNRNVHYSHLPPGDVTFRVIADNGEGIWDMRGARMKLSIAGPYYRTWWFLSLCALAAALITAVAWRMRMAGLIHARELQRRFLHRLIQSQEQERKRLAGELHDSLAQRLTMVKNLALLNGREGANSAGDKMGLIAAEAGEGLREVREISYALRPYQLDYLGLRAALEALVNKVASLGQTEFSCDFAGIEDSVSEEEEINLYRIVQECLQNIVKHAQAKHAEVLVSRNGGHVWLQITDDGVGFRPGENHAGLGLTSISERVQLLGGKLTIQSAPGQGTSFRIELRAKAPNARNRK